MEATLEAVKRSDSGKNEARRHRAAGRLPAVVYGTAKDGKAPEGVPVTVDPKTVKRRSPPFGSEDWIVSTLSTRLK